MSRPLVRALLCAAVIVVVVAGTSAPAPAKPAAWKLWGCRRATLSGTGIEPTGISCITHALCIAVDYYGRVFALRGTHSEEVASTGYLPFAVSCPAKNFCMAMGSDWSTPVTVSDIEGSGIQAISSAGGTCEIVLDAGQFAYLYAGKHPPKLPVLCDEVTCARTLT